MRAAGMDYARSRISKSDLEGDLRRVLEAFGGRYFTQESYAQAGGRYSTTTLKERLRCASWAELLETVLQVRPAPRVMVKRVRAPRPPTPRKRTRLTPESLLAELRATAAKSSSEALSYAEYRALGGSYSIGTFHNHIGGWQYAVSLVGRVDGSSHRRPHLTFTNEDLFAEMQRVWEILGRQPKSREMDEHGAPSHQTFRDRFGSWMRAVYAFCEDRGSADDHPEAPPPVGACEAADASEPLSSVVREQGTEHATAGALVIERTTPTVGTCEATDALAPLPSATQQGARHVAAGILVIQKATPRAPSLRLRFRVFQRDRFTCRACGRSPATQSGVVLHVDHIVPYSGPGETILDNLQTLCEQCNLGKSDSLASSE
jgi:hypothetical protein